MLKLKDKYGKEHECDVLDMVIDFDLYRDHDNNSDYKAYFMIVGHSFAEPGEFIVKGGFDYYEIADEFIDLKKQLIATQPKVQAYYLSKQKEVETLWTAS